MKPLARLRTDVTTKAVVQAPGALAAAGAAFVLYEDPTLFEVAIGVAVGAAFVGASSGWMMWFLRRKPLIDRTEISRLPAGAERETAGETRRHHLARMPLYLAVDVLVIAVFAIIGAGLLVSVTAASLILAWRLGVWEERSRAVLFYERRKAWELRPQKPYWYYEPGVSSSSGLSTSS